MAGGPEVTSANATFARLAMIIAQAMNGTISTLLIRPLAWMTLDKDAHISPPKARARPSGTEPTGGAERISLISRRTIPAIATSDPATNRSLIRVPRNSRENRALGTISKA
jgi:hypothetical protein